MTIDVRMAIEIATLVTLVLGWVAMYGNSRAARAEGQAAFKSVSHDVGEIKQDMKHVSDNVGKLSQRMVRVETKLGINEPLGINE